MTAAEKAAMEKLGEVPTAEALEPRGKAALNFKGIVQERQHLKAKMEELKSRLDQVNSEITDWLMLHDAKRVLAGKWLVTLVEGVSASLSKERLLELGVPATTIVAATKETPYVTVQVRVREGKK